MRSLKVVLYGEPDAWKLLPNVVTGIAYFDNECASAAQPTLEAVRVTGTGASCSNQLLIPPAGLLTKSSET